MTEPVDVNDPRVWWASLMAAVEGLQRGDMGPAREHWRFVRQHRDKATADKAIEDARRYAEHPAFQPAELRHLPMWRPTRKKAET